MEIEKLKEIVRIRGIYENEPREAHSIQLTVPMQTRCSDGRNIFIEPYSTGIGGGWAE